MPACAPVSLPQICQISRSNRCSRFAFFAAAYAAAVTAHDSDY